MNKITLIASALLLTAVQAFAQKEFKLAKSSGKLVINNISRLNVEGYDGKEIIFIAASKKENNNDPRAAGLSALSSNGFDNTGIGISVIEKDGLAIATPVERDVRLTVKLPQGMALSIKATGFSHGDSTVISLKNLKGEIDASTQYENFNLSNVAGPISLKTLYGNIEGKLTPTFKGPVSLISVYGFIDVTVPSNAKADLTVSSQYENLYAAKDLNLIMEERQTKFDGQNIQVYGLKGLTSTTSNSGKGKATTTVVTGSNTSSSMTIEVPTPIGPEKPASPKSPKAVVEQGVYTFSGEPSNFTYTFGGTTVNGKLNGGGEKIILKSTYGKIYIRK